MNSPSRHVRRASITALLCLPGCCVPDCDWGNSESGAFVLQGSQQEELEIVPETFLLFGTPPRRKALVAMAPDTTIRLRVGDYEHWRGQPAVRVEDAKMLDAKVARVDAVEGSTIEVTAGGPGATTLEFTAVADDGSTSDSIGVVVQRPEKMRLTPGCRASQKYWRGLPAVVRYEFSGPAGDYSRRIWGNGYFPVEPLEGVSLKREQSNAYEWVFALPDEPGPFELLGKLPPARSHLEETKFAIHVEEPPRIAGVQLLDVTTGEVVRELLTPIGASHHVRVFPVGENGELMCNTVVPVRVSSGSGVCFVGKADEPNSFGTSAKSQEGRFSIRGREPGNCLLEIEPDLKHLNVVHDGSELTLKLAAVVLATTLATGEGGGGGGVSFDD